jgi:ATP-dependent exoDNAse (exonuclease V) beta subunit
VNWPISGGVRRERWRGFRATYTAALVETWLRGGLEKGGQRQRVQPSDIAVLYPRRRPNADITALVGRLNGFTRAVLPAGDKRTGTLRDEAVKVLPMHSARGLQFRIVVLLWTDLLPSPFKSSDDDIDRGLLYVAMTRADAFCQSLAATL